MKGAKCIKSLKSVRIGGVGMDKAFILHVLVALEANKEANYYKGMLDNRKKDLLQCQNGGLLIIRKWLSDKCTLYVYRRRRFGRKTNGIAKGPFKLHFKRSCQGTEAGREVCLGVVLMLK